MICDFFLKKEKHKKLISLVATFLPVFVKFINKMSAGAGLNPCLRIVYKTLLGINAMCGVVLWLKSFMWD